MNNLTALQRKLVYLGAILVLLIPIIWLGAPSEPASSRNVEGSPGGVLAQLRVKHALGEAELGNVDAASSTMNLLLLGFRGIATSMLWMDALDQQRNKDWAALRASTESIILLQPHFLKVWHFQGWNLAYNVSAEWDGVADRYYWVKEGIKFFKKGRERNERYAELSWYIGDTTGKKIGRADEWKQFRKYFREDPDVARFKGRPDPAVNPAGQDNYLEARVWFQRAIDTIDTYQNEEHIMAPYLFRAYPARARFDFAMILQREGVFDEVGRNAWQEGFEEWVTKYGKMDLKCNPPVSRIHLEVPEDEYARLLAEDLKNSNPWERVTFYVDLYRKSANYFYWRTRSQVESEQEMSDAHREMYEAEQAALRTADFAKARRLYWDGMTRYEKLIKKYSLLKDEDETVEEGLIAVLGWRFSLEVDDMEIPTEHPLKEMWESHASRREIAREEFNRRRRAPR